MKVSVVMITYNHAKYIQKAIESILDQETNFEIELIISNDNSPDDTDLIVKKIISTHSQGNKIKYFKHEENIGMMNNFLFSLKKGSGEYIALCEGDDYWTDSKKLQKQIDFLDNNKDYSICFHNVNVLEKNILKENNIKTDLPDTSTIMDLAKGNFMHTPSVVYRNHLFKNFPEYFALSPIGDYFLHMLNAKHGKIKYYKDYMAVYRIHETSYWSSKQQLDRENIWIGFIENIKPNFDKKVQKILSKQVYNLKKGRLKGLKRQLYKLEYFFKNS
ncbi:glycosyltransferase family 2 protein [Flavobacterium terrae]|uniref:Glycosyltransferase involved in cell wall bisynthesis n=1 Tax=Flavobacterium terrae TaxID=415425 RepID=A0A1M6CR79_9FLAO|nr:glycosyltransferase [Flavobacterium terrae]SHI63383.1 Glycosyltransferase involved in cell wall bisynthesis [Flavobacterium terrae]